VPAFAFLALILALTTPSPDDIFQRAQAAWNARVLPPYESFRIACSETFLAPKCAADAEVEFIVRLADGRTYAHTVGDAASQDLLHGGYITGPAGAPFGFYRRIPSDGAGMPPSPPPNLALDPLGTIATVRAVDRAYDVTLAGTEQIDGHTAYHLRLKPLRDPDRYPLRELWVDQSSFQVVRLTYIAPFDGGGHHATIHYDFAPVGPQSVWSIVHIDAQATTHELFSAQTQSVSEDLHDIAFPSTEPPNYFEP
jgi:hypothetical protein